MKANWDESDYLIMRVKNLEFTREDKAMIASHLAQSRALEADESRSTNF